MRSTVIPCKKLAIITLIMFVVVQLASSQPSSKLFTFAAEKIINKYSDSIARTYIGSLNGTQSFTAEVSGELKVFNLEEPNSGEVSDKSFQSQIPSKVIRALRFESTFLYIGIFDFSSNSEYGKQDLWISRGKLKHKIATFPYDYREKYYSLNFSSDGSKIVCNPFTDMTTSYDRKEDGFVIIFDLSGLEKRTISVDSIPCENCLNSILIGDYLYFQKDIPIGNGFDGDFHNIYKAPLSQLNDTVLVATNATLEGISPDLKFMLAQKYLFGKWTPVIIDLQSRKYQYLLVRRFPMDNWFYSKVQNKFAFDFGAYLVYVETPNKFPFDAIERNQPKFTAKTENAKFWQKYGQRPN